MKRKISLVSTMVLTIFALLLTLSACTEPECTHEYTSEITKEATCTAEGVLTYSCMHCDESYTEPIETTAHNFVQVDFEPATCTESGYISFEKCTECNTTSFIPQDALNHLSGEAVEENIIEPTCEQEGSYESVIYCARCNTELERKTVITEKRHKVLEGECVFCHIPDSSPGLEFYYREDAEGSYFLLSGIGSCTEKDIVIGLYDGYPVKIIGQYAFDKCSNIESITIANCVTEIFYNAFNDCSNLKEINIPNSVHSIGMGAFENCTKLKSVVIPAGITKIEDATFYGCESLEDITIPDSVTSIGSGAFLLCESLNNINIPNGVTIIDDYAFRNCSNLVNITIPDSVTTIGDSAFSECEKLESINLSNELTEISFGLFFNCKKLESITIPNSVTVIDMVAFSESGIESVTFGNGIKTIEADAFMNCENLKYLNFANEYQSLIINDRAFENCVSLETVILPEGLTSLEWGVFNGCTSLTNISISNSITNFAGWNYDESLVFNEYDNAYYLGNASNPYLILIKEKNTDTSY